MEQYHREPVRVYGISNWEVLNSLRKEIFRDFPKVLATYVTLVALGIGVVVGANKINEYCSANKREISVNELKISYTPSTSQTLDKLVK